MNAYSTGLDEIWMVLVPQAPLLNRQLFHVDCHVQYKSPCGFFANQWGTRSSPFCGLALQIWTLCHWLGVSTLIRHIREHLNVAADSLSCPHSPVNTECHLHHRMSGMSTSSCRSIRYSSVFSASDVCIVTTCIPRFELSILCPWIGLLSWIQHYPNLRFYSNFFRISSCYTDWHCSCLASAIVIFSSDMLVSQTFATISDSSRLVVSTSVSFTTSQARAYSASTLVDDRNSLSNRIL